MPPSRTGYQADAPPLAGEARREEITGQPTVEDSFRAHLIASLFGTIHAATFRFPQPVGTGIPSSGLQMATYTSRDETAPFVRSPRVPPPNRRAHAGQEGSDREFPEINRALKGPRLVPRVRPDFDSPQPSTIEGSNPARGRLPPAPAKTQPQTAPKRGTPTRGPMTWTSWMSPAPRSHGWLMAMTRRSGPREFISGSPHWAARRPHWSLGGPDRLTYSSRKSFPPTLPFPPPFRLRLAEEDWRRGAGRTGRGRSRTRRHRRNRAATRPLLQKGR